ncbi:MAG: phosphoribosylamine--glycine ligase [Proteobacteria bacterium]|nr:phosphoribosylamine--glycine ligase [Pseudomonadota bacterium]MCL2308067.1 phosphoribosylamine--glycine ligase [Pseudomonadota bacterium]
MNLLIIGNGGREHAFAWKVAQSPRIAKVFVAPGNAGTAREEGVINVPIAPTPDRFSELIDFVRRENIAMTLVGPEAPLAAGIVDAFRKADLRIFGPTQAAAQLESSKDFAKRFMQRHGIPTASSQTFTDPDAACAYVETHALPVVIKADGLAAGKGVVVALTREEALATVTDMLSGHALGDAGARVVIETFLDGEEASFIVMSDGVHVLPLASSQDHKRLRDNDEGPNTGGMGAYSPAPVVSPELHARIMREIIMPTIQGMAAEGHVFTGFLYAGVMVSPQGDPYVIEFNCRMGDPETQPIMMRMRTDFVDLIEHGIDGTLDAIECEWTRHAALGVVIAAPGYPQAPKTGAPIKGLDADSGSNGAVKTFHAGTRQEGDAVVTAGGRVLCVTALGESIKLAQRAAYHVVDAVTFEGKQCRRDIGYRALARQGSDVRD